jgi:hypothetical protein
LWILVRTIQNLRHPIFLLQNWFKKYLPGKKLSKAMMKEVREALETVNWENVPGTA